MENKIKELKKEIIKFVGSFDPETNDDEIFNKLLDKMIEEAQKGFDKKVEELKKVFKDKREVDYKKWEIVEAINKIFKGDEK